MARKVVTATKTRKRRSRKKGHEMRKPFDKTRDVTLECPKCRAYKTIDRANQNIPAEVVLIEIICPECDDGDRHVERWFSAPGVEVSQKYA